MYGETFGHGACEEEEEAVKSERRREVREGSGEKFESGEEKWRPWKRFFSRMF